MGKESEKRGKFEIEQPSPLVGDHNRVGGDMIVDVEIIAGRTMRDALTRRDCQLVTVLETNNDLPSGANGSQLKTQLTGSKDYSKKTAAYR